jgi:hypothetical protein
VRSARWRFLLVVNAAAAVVGVLVGIRFFDAVTR